MTSRREDIAKAAVVTAEVLGHELSPAAALAIARDLAEYDPTHVAIALRRCTRELRGRLTLADVLQRLPGQHPGAEEAWAMCPRSEDVTVVWTEQIASAWGLAKPLLDEGDQIAARMAFREAYTRAVSEAIGMPQWSPSMGRDSQARAAVIIQAVELGRISREYADQIAGPFQLPSGESAKQLTGTTAPDSIRALLPSFAADPVRTNDRG